MTRRHSYTTKRSGDAAGCRHDHGDSRAPTILKIAIGLFFPSRTVSTIRQKIKKKNSPFLRDTHPHRTLLPVSPRTANASQKLRSTHRHSPIGRPSRPPSRATAALPCPGIADHAIGLHDFEAQVPASSFNRQRIATKLTFGSVRNSTALEIIVEIERTPSMRREIPSPPGLGSEIDTSA